MSSVKWLMLIQFFSFSFKNRMSWTRPKLNLDRGSSYCIPWCINGIVRWCCCFWKQEHGLCDGGVVVDLKPALQRLQRLHAEYKLKNTTDRAYVDKTWMEQTWFTGRLLEPWNVAQLSRVLNLRRPLPPPCLKILCIRLNDFIAVADALAGTRTFRGFMVDECWFPKSMGGFGYPFLPIRCSWCKQTSSTDSS